jgi:CubicO group peptidase (beta-lactamase class C family)
MKFLRSPLTVARFRRSVAAGQTGQTMVAKVVRRALAVLAMGTAMAQASAQDSPRYRTDGPDAQDYGLGRGYPMCKGLAYIDDKGCRVGAFSNFGTLFPSREVRAPATASPLRRIGQEPLIRYEFEGKSRSLDDYLDTYPVTGLLIAKDDTILVERYQYARTDKQLLTSFSMAKTIIGLLVGIALEQGLIRSIDDAAEVYVPELRGTEYGRTPIKALLQMASGVAFNENYADRSADIYVLARLTLEQDPAGTLNAVKRFNTRRHPPGEVYSYSSAESSVLGLVVARATGRTVSQFASEVLWQPLGAEADAHWNIDATGQEVTFAYFNAVLRDYARLGLMLAHRGKWAGRTIVPDKWITASTSVDVHSPSPTYGYHLWISHYNNKRFYLLGLRGQIILVDPERRMVMLQTGLANSERSDTERGSLFLAAMNQFK